MFLYNELLFNHVVEKYFSNRSKRTLIFHHILHEIFLFNSFHIVSFLMKIDKTSQEKIYSNRTSLYVTIHNLLYVYVFRNGSMFSRLLRVYRRRKRLVHINIAMYFSKYMRRLETYSWGGLPVYTHRPYSSY